MFRDGLIILGLQARATRPSKDDQFIGAPFADPESRNPLWTYVLLKEVG
jgi:hypothetical protein